MTNESDVTSTRSGGRTLSTEELDQIVGGRATGDQHNLLSTTDDAALLHGSNEPPPMPQMPKGVPRQTLKTIMPENAIFSTSSTTAR
jgi:bacteriocin-like protein